MSELIIAADRAERQYWSDLWRYRQLFYYLAWRDLLVRYKQTVVGVAWSLLKPLMSMVVLTVVFGKLGKMPSGNVPYPLLVFCGVLPWQFFSTALSESGSSLVNNSSLISKVYFPRMVIPVSSVIASFVDFLISTAFLLLIMFWYHYPPTTNLLFFPLFVILVFSASLGVSLWISALMVEYRDFRFIVPFFVQFGLYISPVGFRSDLVPERFRLLYGINPIVGIIDGFRWCVIGNQERLRISTIGSSVTCVLLILISGIWYFRKMERTFADVI
jgi:lipopolysaccharide transport system permease protein